MPPKTLAACLVAALSTGCVLGPTSSQDAGSGGNAAMDDHQYDATQSTLDQGRTQVLGKTAQGLVTAGTELYWLDFTDYDPTLHRANDGMQGRVDYGFGVGGGDAYNFRASTTTVVTAEPDSGVLHAYDAAQPNAHLGDATPLLMPSSAGVKFWSYAVDGDTVYYVTNAPGDDEIYVWDPRSGGSPSKLTTLEASGMQFGEFQDFSVVAGTMYFIAGGQLFTMDLSAHVVTEAPTMTEVGDQFDFANDGILYTYAKPDDTGALAYWDGKRGSAVRTLSDEIAQSTYSLNASYTSAHLWAGRGFARWGRWVVYPSDDGVYGYD